VLYRHHTGSTRGHTPQARGPLRPAEVDKWPAVVGFRHDTDRDKTRVGGRGEGGRKETQEEKRRRWPGHTQPFDRWNERQESRLCPGLSRSQHHHIMVELPGI
jgi:hypothetical protein